MAKFRVPWKVSILAPLDVVWRPHIMMILWYEVNAIVALRLNVSAQRSSSQAMVFGFSIGINVCSRECTATTSELSLSLGHKCSLSWHPTSCRIWI